VCVVKRESELPGLPIALMTVLTLQPRMRVQLFVVDNVEEALAHALSCTISLLVPDGRVEISACRQTQARATTSTACY